MLKTPKTAYASFLEDTRFPLCWYCGAWPNQVPSWWFAPFLIERAHIVNKPRREDPRAIILLCSACHKAAHGERFRAYARKPLDKAGMLWLKSYLDGANFDLAWLQKHSVRILPKPVSPWETLDEIPAVFRQLMG
jgi:hypothetical protein